MPRQRPPTPVDPALEALNSAQPGVVLLHSGRHHPRWSTRSILAQPGIWFRHFADGRSELLNTTDLSETVDRPPAPTRPFTGNIWSDLRQLLNDPNFPGHWIGYLSYDLGRVIEPAKLRAREDPAGWPLVELGWCPEEAVERFPSREAKSGEDEMGPPIVPGLRSNFTREGYETIVRRALEYIGAGDIFQVNLAQQFTAPYIGDPRWLFRRLATVSPAWYGAYLELPSLHAPDTGKTHAPAQRALLSTSPELFLELRDRRVITRPIKGTRPNPQRGTTGPSSQDPNRAALLRSAKDAAELNMIVDLMRNDLGRVCAYGSVRVTHPREIESHPTVHHATATIEGALHESKDIVDLLRAALPGGSITGAPKIRAMQIIDQLEPASRGPYCGCIGSISKNEASLNIAIRTILLAQTSGSPNSIPDPAAPSYTARFSVGGGIVADSDPASEYEETLAKARAMFQALGNCRAPERESPG